MNSYYNIFKKTKAPHGAKFLFAEVRIVVNSQQIRLNFIWRHVDYPLRNGQWPDNNFYKAVRSRKVLIGHFAKNLWSNLVQSFLVVDKPLKLRITVTCRPHYCFTEIKRTFNQHSLK